MERWDFNKLFSFLPEPESEGRGNPEIWSAYAVSKEPALRQRLIESNLRLVLFVVRRLRCYVPPSMERDDLISCGIIGLIEAVDRFDPAKGFEFSTFAVKRIRGAIYDGICQYSGLTRYGYVQYREKWKGEELFSEVCPTALKESRCEFEGDEGNPEQWLDDQEERESVKEAVHQLSELQRSVIFQHYYSEKPLRQIAAQLQYSPSWVGRLHQAALSSLRWLLTQRGMGDMKKSREKS